MTFKWDLGLQPNWTIVSNGTFTPQGAQLWHIILKSMHKCRRYGPDKLNLLAILSSDLQVWPWPSTYLNNVSKGTATPQREQLYQIILKSMHKCRSYGWDKRNICDLQVWHWPSTYLKCFKLHFSASWRQLCQIILKSMHKCGSYGLDQSRLMHARTHALMHARTYTEKNCNSYVSLYCQWVRQILYLVEHLSTSYFFQSDNLRKRGSVNALKYLQTSMLFQ